MGRKIGRGGMGGIESGKIGMGEICRIPDKGRKVESEHIRELSFLPAGGGGVCF